MNIIKGLGILSIFLLLFGSCFSPPEFPITPSIEYDDIFFGKGSDIDSLVLSIKFKDGDGDLGLNGDDPIYNNDPYHPLNFFLENNGKVDSANYLTTDLLYSDLPPFIKVPPGATGKLATVRSRKKPGGGKLPPYSCVNYTYTSVYISGEDAAIFDSTYNLDTTYVSPGFPNVYVLKDTFLIEPNPNHYNIEVDFLIYEPNNSQADKDGFVEYDFEKEFCTTYDGRFPVLSETKTPLEGTITYAMKSTGFKYIFSLKQLKLRVQIKDRALHLSNKTETGTFTLEGITRK